MKTGDCEKEKYIFSKTSVLHLKQQIKKKVDAMLLIKNADVYTPEHIGKKDVLIAGEKIEYIANEIKEPEVPCEVVDASGLKLVPGLIDQHVHVTGGGGEGSFHTRTPEIELSELIKAGITTVVGLLGTDGITRSVENLYAKTMALNEEGVTAYMLTGAYGYPSPTITGEPDKDIVFMEKVLGVKLAISDHRAPNVTVDELIQLASKTRVAGMMSGKPGIVVLHMGNGKGGLDPVFEALEKTNIPVGIFRPTHVGRCKSLIEDGYKLLEMGGYIDLTCGSRKSGGPTKHILEAMKRKLPLEHITISTDGHGSWSNYDKLGNLLQIGVSSTESLMKELRHMVMEGRISLDRALPFFTTNVAQGLGLSGKKGCVQVNADADMLLLNDKLEVNTVITKGNILMQNEKLIVKGTYEQ